MNDAALLAVLHAAVDAAADALATLGDWGLAGTRPGQYRSDLAADRVAVEVLTDAGLGVLSEESGEHWPERDIVVALDPVDGSTNAARGLPWFATSVCALDELGPRAAVVANQSTGVRYEAVRGGGAHADGVTLQASGCTSLARAVVGVNGHPPSHPGWRQSRVLGAAALDLCAVASGVLDAYVDWTGGSLAPWDYLGGLLVCVEAGASIADAFERPLVARGHGDRRAPVAAATGELLAEVLAARASRR